MFRERKRDIPPSFSNGVVTINQMGNNALPGDFPEWVILRQKHQLRFIERTVGVYRRMMGLQQHIRIDRMLRCQRLDDVDTNDMARLNGIDYHIRQIQYPEGVYPPVMDLSLERVRQDDT